MLSINENDRLIRYEAYAGQTLFAFNFPVIEKCDIQVSRLGATDSVLTLDEDYSVDGLKRQGGGYVRLTVAAEENDVYLIKGARKIERVTQFQIGIYQAEIHDDEFNILYLLLQELNQKLFGVPNETKTYSTEETEAAAAAAIAAAVAVEGLAASLTARVDGLANLYVSLDSCVCDSNTDDTVAFQAILDGMKQGDILDGKGKTVRIDSPINLPDFDWSYDGNATPVTFRNFTIDYSHGGSDPCLNLTVPAAERPAPEIITNELVIQEHLISVADSSSFAVNDLVLIDSGTNYWNISKATPWSEIRRVKSVSAGQITLTDGVDYHYPGGSDCQIRKLKYKVAPNFKNVSAFGHGNGSQKLMLLEFVHGGHWHGGFLRKFDNFILGISSFSRFFDINHVHLDECKLLGFSYGIVIATGAEHISVNNCMFENMRHGVTLGGSRLVRHCTITNCEMKEMLDGGIDSHYPADFCTFDNIHISMSKISAASSGDGVMMQGARMRVTNVTVENAPRHGIAIQPLIDDLGGVENWYKISGKINQAGDRGLAIYATVTDIAQIDVDLRVRKTTYHAIDIQAKSANIKNVTVNADCDYDNASAYLCFLSAQAGFRIDYAKVSGRFRNANPGQVLIRNYGTANKGMIVHDAVLAGGSYGVVSNSVASIVSGCIYHDIATALTSGVTTVANNTEAPGAGV